MPAFMVAAVGPLLPPPPTGPAPVKIVHQMYVAQAADEQAAIDLVAGWDSEPAGTDYLAFQFNPRKATGGGS